MRTKYEIIEVDKAEITVDVSLLIKSEEMFFNATDMAKPFGKRPNDFWKQPLNQEYLNALITLTGGNKKSFVRTQKGKYGGTYFHNDLALQFGRWLSPLFGVKLDKWFIKRLREEHERKRARLEAKTGFLPMTEAITGIHDPTKPYHFSNEADMINRIVLGMPSKKFKEQMGVENVRDGATAAQLAELNNLQIVNTGLIKIGMSFHDRKEHLIKCHNHELILLGEVA